MRKLAGLLCLAGLFMLMLPAFAGSDNEKVTICHAAGREGTTHYETLNISENAVYGEGGHFYENGTPRAGHEDDYFGECQEDEGTTTTVESTTSTPPSSNPTPPPTESSTTTLVEETTTTLEPTTSSTVTEGTVTIPTQPPCDDCVVTTLPPVTETTAPPETSPSTLPFTGASDALPLAGVALLGLGSLVLLWERMRSEG